MLRGVRLSPPQPSPGAAAHEPAAPRRCDRTCPRRSRQLRQHPRDEPYDGVGRSYDQRAVVEQPSGGPMLLLEWQEFDDLDAVGQRLPRRRVAADDNNAFTEFDP